MRFWNPILVAGVVAGTTTWGAAFAYQCIYECDDPGQPCAWISGSSQTYHIDSDDFVTWQKDNIEAAASAWSAGSAGDVLQGADWHFVRGSDISNSYMGDGLLGVAMRNDTWFSDQGCAGCPGMVIYSWPFCERGETDIYINSSVSFVPQLPSAVSDPANDRSLQQVAMHEFGHIFGFNHDNETGGNAALDTMDSNYPAGGDPANSLRVLEDEYVGMAAVKGDSSTGTNLMLSKFEYLSSGKAVEVWDNGREGFEANDWSEPRGSCVSPASKQPNQLVLLATGTTSPITNVEVAWYLSQNAICFDSDDLLMDEVTVSAVYVNTPAEVQADWCIPQTALQQTYYKVCAKVDPDGLITETSETDNRVQSEKLFYVE